jgi:hypothetical protein
MKNIKMNKPDFITFTGVDDRTDLKRCKQLQDLYPIEWGILFSLTNKDARYPSLQTFEEAKELTGRKALHLCGAAAREFVDGKLPELLIENDLFEQFGRIQVNGTYPSPNFPVTNKEIILQARQDFDIHFKFFQLFDCSGGRGIFPESLPWGLPDKLVGYAGGINPDNVFKFLELITHSDNFYIDMESGVRTNGWFDLDKVETVCQQVFEGSKK